MLALTVMAIGTAPGNVLRSSEHQPAKHDQAKPPANGQSGADKEKQQTATKEAECSNPSQTYDDCLIQLRTARATERQANEAWTAGRIAIGALLFAALAATAALWAAVETRKTARAAIAATKVSQTSLRHSAKLGREQTRIAETSADAAIRSANASEHALQALERPYLAIEKITSNELVYLFERPKPSLDYTILNYGKTPAFFRSISVRLEYKPEHPLRLPLHIDEEFYAVVLPGQRLPRAGFPDDAARIEVEGSADYQRYKAEVAEGLVFHGSITYDGADGFMYVDRFSLRATKDAKEFVPLGGAYNYRRSYDLREKDPSKDKT